MLYFIYRRTLRCGLAASLHRVTGEEGLIALGGRCKGAPTYFTHPQGLQRPGIIVFPCAVSPRSVGERARKLRRMASV